MLNDLTTGVVRILDSTGTTTGTGFFITSDGLIVTCAHVLETAGVKPGDCVEVIIHTNGKLREACVLSNGWHPIVDVAFVQLKGPLPEDIVPVKLGSLPEQEGQSVKAFGYPDIGAIEGLWGDGRLVGRVIDGQHALLQLSSEHITRGFSGGPVWDMTAGRVIGMVVQIATQDRYGRLDDVAFAIPAELLRDLAPKPVPLKSVSSGTNAPFIVPFMQNPGFVGREENLEQLHQALVAEGPA